MGIAEDVSVVVINYNGKTYLEKCLGELTKYNELSEIIVVDDASTDGSAELVRKKYSNVILIINKENSGPVHSRQVGFKRAKNKYIYFIDSDVLVQKKTIINLYEFLESNPKYWLAGSKLFEKDGGDTPWNYGHYPNVWKNFILFFKKDKYSKISEYKTVDWVSEASFLVRREILDKIGGFDLNFFMFHEAPDISLRATKFGYLTALEPKSKATHLSQKIKLKERNRFRAFQDSTKYFYKKHYNFISYIFIYLLITLHFGTRKIGIKNKRHYE